MRKGGHAWAQVTVPGRSTPAVGAEPESDGGLKDCQPAGWGGREQPVGEEPAPAFGLAGQEL